MKQVIPSTKTGRCANGYERDQGKIVHAVMATESEMNWGAYWLAAMCGTKPGTRSVGWCDRKDLVVTCPKCLKKLKSNEIE